MNPFGLKEDNPSQRNCLNQLSHPSLSHIEQQCHETLLQGKTHIQQNIFGQRPQMFIQLSFNKFCNSELSGLHAFDNMAVIH